jgi:hypothetical protein
MKRRDAELAMKAAKKAGITVFRVASMVNKGEVVLMRKYNKSGDSLCFNPYSSIGDAMLLAMNDNLCVDFYVDKFIVETKIDGASIRQIQISFKGPHKNTMEYRIGNAIVNIINQ